MTDEPTSGVEAERDALREALAPFASCIFNDNGDITVNFRTFTADELIAAYFAYKRARTLTTAQARIRELEKRERTIERIVTELERQNKVNDGYASSLPKAERATSELWLICNSHTKDRTCELRQALKEASE